MKDFVSRSMQIYTRPPVCMTYPTSDFLGASVVHGIKAFENSCKTKTAVSLEQFGLQKC